MKHLLFLGIAFAAFHISHSNTPDFCQKAADEGQGTNFLYALYYNPTQDQCSPFIYKGQGGNENRFENERECMRNCSRSVETVYPMDASLACHFKKKPGSCNGHFLRYYYDSVHNKCKKFLWTGCIGNGNRFFDYNSCNTTCAGIHDDGNEGEEEEPDTPIAIICGVLLAVITVAIFTSVIVLTIQSKKKKAFNEKGAGKSRDVKSDSPLQEPAIEMA
ncbi:boophilin-G2 [Morone saxatilis]|uniref:boophilin-G2 n=1 Tax=Morone saxatilis TaxID=34816 RepID=UPI0015E23E14|nr:boophilin-G2 [Morone saxatilis]